MSDAAIATICAAAVQITILVVGLLKIRYGVESAEKKAGEASSKATEVGEKMDKAATKAATVEDKLDANTALTEKIEKHTNGPLSARLAQLDDHARRIAALESSLEALSKNIDSTRHEMRGHLQAITTKLDILSLLGGKPKEGA